MIVNYLNDKALDALAVGGVRCIHELIDQLLASISANLIYALISCLHLLETSLIHGFRTSDI